MEKSAEKKARTGRPTKQMALLKRIASAGVDPALVNARHILAGIAVDTGAPASARVAAAKALLADARKELPGDPARDPAQMPMQGLDDLSRRALEIIARTGKAN